jgi:RNA polymerase sigma factor (sigma-70 family)
MDAVVSGRAGVAILLDNGSLMSFDVDEPATLLPRSQSDVPLLFGEANDLQFLENINHKSAAQALERAFNCASALDLTLILLDYELSTDVRKDAADELERLLSNTQVLKYLENVLYGRPLPGAADLAGALEHCGSTRNPNLLATLQILDAHQPAIREVCQAWDALPVHLFGGRDDKAEFLHVAVSAGLFRKLASELANKGYSRQLLRKSLLNPAFTALSNYREILQQWMKPFRRTTTAPNLKHETVAQAGQKTPSRKKRRKDIKPEVVLRDVQSQRPLIIESLRQHDLDRAKTPPALRRSPETFENVGGSIRSNSNAMPEGDFAIFLQDLHNGRGSIDDFLRMFEVEKWLRVFSYRYSFQVFGGTYSPEDLFWESFEKVLKSAPQLKPENMRSKSAFRGWLSTRVHTTFLDALRKLNKPRNSGQLRSDEPADLLNIHASEVDYDGKYFLGRFLKFIRRYPEAQQHAVEYWLGGGSYREIAQALNDEGTDCSHLTVRKWVEAILKSFKEGLGESET